MPNITRIPMDKIAMAISLGGVLLAVLTAVAGSLLGQIWGGPAYIVFAVFQCAALVVGLSARARPMGKPAAITAGLLLTASVLLLG